MNVVLALSILCPWVSRGGYGQAERSGDGDESLVIRIHVIMMMILGYICDNDEDSM